MAYQMERLLKEQGEKVPAQDRSNIESAIGALRTALKGDDAQAIQRAMENLERSSHKIAEEMYKSAAAGAKAAGPAPEEPQEKPKKDQKGGDDVIDAEYEVKE
jgi:molecular chaperone DnaK